MVIGTATIKLDISYAHTLKEKRMIIKSIIAKAQNKFNISIAETEDMDVIKTAVISFAYIAANTALADSIMENVLKFVDDNTDADVFLISRDNILS